MTLSFRTWLRTLFGLLLLVLSLFGVVSYRNTNALTQTRDQVAQSSDVLARIEGLRAELETVEAAERDFLLSGEDRHLEPHYVATRVALRSVADLRRLTADN